MPFHCFYNIFPLKSVKYRINATAFNDLEYCIVRTVNPQVPGSSPGRGAKIHLKTTIYTVVFILYLNYTVITRIVWLPLVVFTLIWYYTTPYAYTYH